MEWCIDEARMINRDRKDRDRKEGEQAEDAKLNKTFILRQAIIVAVKRLGNAVSVT